MFSRRAAKAAVACAAASAAALASLTFSGVAAATGPAKGSNVPGAAAAVTPFTAGQTFDSGQKVNIVIPANSVLAPNQKLFILECGAPGGVDPMTVDDCDGNTNYASGTISTNSDGSVNLSNAHKALYPIYALPDHFKLGETSSSAGACGLGSANECVLYIGQGGGSDMGFSQPYYFSQPFQVHPDATDSGTVNPGDGTFPADSAPVITSASSATFTEGSSSSFTVTASGWPPPTIAESGALPAGVNFDPGTDVLSGTPTVTGTFPISFTPRQRGAPRPVQSFNLTVSGPGGIPDHDGVPSQRRGRADLRSAFGARPAGQRSGSRRESQVEEGPGSKGTEGQGRRARRNCEQEGRAWQRHGRDPGDREVQGRKDEVRSNGPQDVDDDHHLITPSGSWARAGRAHQSCRCGATGIGRSPIPVCASWRDSSNGTPAGQRAPVSHPQPCNKLAVS